MSEVVSGDAITIRVAKHVYDSCRRLRLQLANEIECGTYVGPTPNGVWPSMSDAVAWLVWHYVESVDTGVVPGGPDPVKSELVQGRGHRARPKP